MRPAIYEELTEVLQREPLPLNRVHALVQQSGSTWSEEQLCLFLICTDGVEVDTLAPEVPLVRLGQSTPQEALIEAIVQVVKSRASRPVPAAQVRQLLPSQFVTTEAQIKALAKKATELEVFGAGLIRMKNF